jgi:hypothetical protein
MFDCPDTTPIGEAEPVAVHEVVLNLPDDSGGWRLTLTPDVALVSGGTAVMPSTGAIAAGDLPAPWNAPVTHADRRVGATRGAITFLR